MNDGSTANVTEPRAVDGELVFAEHECTDAANAVKLSELVEGRFRYVIEEQCWYRWGGTVWARDDTGALIEQAKNLAADIFEQALQHEGKIRQRIIRHAVWTGSRRGIMAAVDLLRTIDGYSESVDQLDTKTHLFACNNGTVDLTTGELRPSRREDRLTQRAPVPFDPEARCPRWEQFVAEVLPDQETVDFVQRAIGYSLTGETREQCMFIMQGGGANGKTTFMETVMDLAGAHGHRTSADTLLVSRDSGDYGMAMLRGKRLIVASESERGRRLAEGRIKELTGGDTVNARLPYGRPFTFRPIGKIWLGTNHRPLITGTDHAIWRRIHLIDFPNQFDGKGRDDQLRDKLKAELPGILAWCVRGAADWYANGLRAPEPVCRATRAYREEQDVLAQFLADQCVEAAGVSVQSSVLFTAWRRWCEHGGEHAGTQKSFSSMMDSRGFTKDKTKAGMMWRGVGMR